jgi:hypothetical protein
MILLQFQIQLQRMFRFLVFAKVINILILKQKTVLHVHKIVLPALHKMFVPHAPMINLLMVINASIVIQN